MFLKYSLIKYIFRLLEVKKKEALEGKLKMVERRISEIRSEEMKLTQRRNEQLKTLKEAQSLRCGNRDKMIEKLQIVCDVDSQHLVMTE